MDKCETDLSKLEEILLKYPGLVILQTKSKNTSLQGPIKIKNDWLNIKIIFYNFPQINTFQLQVQKSFNNEIFRSADLNIPAEWSIEDLIDSIPAFAIPAETSITNLSNILYDEQTNIYAEIANLYAPTAYNILLNDNCSVVRFTKFLQNEQHFLEVELPSLKLLEHSLPSCVEWRELFAKSTSLTLLVQQYKTYLEDLRPFYENFTDIDELCHVVQPPLPTTKSNWRLFLLKERVFLKVQFNDPFSPLSSKSVHIIGRTAEVTQLRRIFSEGMRDWDNELDVHKNLLRIFDLCYFPMPPAEGSQAYLQCCSICYCYKLDHGEVPIVSCDNSHCSLIFHVACLKEWFNTLADGKTFLDVAFGVCPFCKAKLSTSFHEVLSSQDNLY